MIFKNLIQLKIILNKKLGNDDETRANYYF